MTDKKNYVSKETVKLIDFAPDVLEEYTKEPIDTLDSVLVTVAAVKSKFFEEKKLLLEEIVRRNDVEPWMLNEVINYAFFQGDRDGELRSEFKKRLILKCADAIAQYGEKYPNLVDFSGKELVRTVYMFIFKNEQLRDEFAKEYASNLRDLVYKYISE